MKNLKQIPVIVLLGLLLSACASSSPNVFINSPNLIKPNGYTHAIKSQGKITIYIAGQVPFNSNGELVGKGDFRAQAEKTFDNIKSALESAGASFDDVVKMTTFIAEYNPEKLAIIREVRANYISKANPPTNTTIGVGTLSPNVLVEIEAIAVIK